MHQDPFVVLNIGDEIDAGWQAYITKAGDLNDKTMPMPIKLVTAALSRLRQLMQEDNTVSVAF